ncbi:hypothetical protein MIND_00634000 [Mycena indigotica]|uniref:Uncharacterized protein n=1 Tax=Mycena indigotica TaxID=2126181 RepID=A0A8H6SRS4_9AGAR|nr:uncharacterized protein MIND_00634000 [Mycena indigotica]KAF7304028.1 hypothetical protein MIND_00634000 [Mycena indigotica]
MSSQSSPPSRSLSRSDLSSSFLSTPSSMQTATPTSDLLGFTSSSLMPQQSGTHPGGSCNGPSCPNSPPPALYLYTFLSTLVILLLVSAAIVIRSLFLRRQQRIAIANGTWIPPPMPFPGGTGRRRHNPYAGLPKPVLFDVFLEANSEKLRESRWNGLQPLCVVSVPLHSDSVVSPTPLPNAPSTLPPSSTSLVPRTLRTAYHYFYPPSPPPTPPPSAPPIPEPKATELSPSDPTVVRLGLLVAMPCPELSPHEEELELPYIEFGVVQVDVADYQSVVSAGSKAPMIGHEADEDEQG